MGIIFKFLNFNEIVLFGGWMFGANLMLWLLPGIKVSKPPPSLSLSSKTVSAPMNHLIQYISLKQCLSAAMSVQTSSHGSFLG